MVEKSDSEGPENSVKFATSQVLLTLSLNHSLTQPLTPATIKELDSAARSSLRKQRDGGGEQEAKLSLHLHFAPF